MTVIFLPSHKTNNNLYMLNHRVGVSVWLEETSGGHMFSAQAGPCIASCPGTCPVGFWINPRLENPQPPLEGAASAWSPLQWKCVSWCSEGTACISVRAHCLWSCRWAQAWLCSLHVFPCSIYPQGSSLPELPLLQGEQSQPPQPFLIGGMLIYNSFWVEKCHFSQFNCTWCITVPWNSEESKQFLTRERPSSVYPSNLDYFAHMWYSKNYISFINWSIEKSNWNPYSSSV